MISEQDQAQEQAMVLARLAIRDAALEEAAKVADIHENCYAYGIDGYEKQRRACALIAKEIRALKSTTRKTAGE